MPTASQSFVLTARQRMGKPGPPAHDDARISQFEGLRPGTQKDIGLGRAIYASRRWSTTAKHLRRIEARSRRSAAATPLPYAPEC